MKQSYDFLDFPNDCRELRISSASDNEWKELCKKYISTTRFFLIFYTTIIALLISIIGYGMGAGLLLIAMILCFLYFKYLYRAYYIIRFGEVEDLEIVSKLNIIDGYHIIYRYKFQNKLGFFISTENFDINQLVKVYMLSNSKEIALVNKSKFKLTR